MIKYMPISDNLDRFKKFTIFENKIVINDEMYPIEKVACVIEEVNKGGYANRGFIVSGWKSLELLCEGKNIGQFYFEIATCNDLFDMSAERVKQLIEDIQKKNVINYDQRIEKDIEASKEDKHDENIVVIILLFFTLIPIGAGFLVYLMTR